MRAALAFLEEKKNKVIIHFGCGILPLLVVEKRKNAAGANVN
jgi:hypothetical protein